MVSLLQQREKSFKGFSLFPIATCQDKKTHNANHRKETRGMTYEEYENKVGKFLFDLSERGYDVFTGDEIGFTWQGCDCCGRPEGGDKHSATGIKVGMHRDGGNIEFRVCEDCLFYLNYGHLDMWEGEINVK
jgi:hypothetical protein